MYILKKHIPELYHSEPQNMTKWPVTLIVIKFVFQFKFKAFKSQNQMIRNKFCSNANKQYRI